MAVMPPGATSPVRIIDLAQETVNRLENRQDSKDRACFWVKDALVEITTNADLRDDFDELEILGDEFLLTPGTQEYPYTNLVPQTNEYGYADYNMATLDVLLWIDPGVNSKRIQLKPTHYQDSDRGVTGSTNSQPSEWYRFGDNIGFNPAPSQAFQVQCRILRGHPINDAAMPFTSILLARNWQDILVWAAVERGYMELGNFEKASYVHGLIYGDPKYPTKPGLINGAKKRRKREAHRQSGALRPIIRPYGWGR